MLTKILLTACTVLAITANASDHLDSPSVTSDAAADIGDLYAWMSPDAKRLNALRCQFEPTGTIDCHLGEKDRAKGDASHMPGVPASTDSSACLQICAMIPSSTTCAGLAPH
jgi:hypothetical protein